MGDQDLLVFVSYSHRDADLCDSLMEHLTPLCHNGVILWRDSESILAGDDAKREVDDKLQRANVVLLLLSSHYLASQPCRYEMNQALQRAAHDSLRVVPVILRACDWQNLPFGDVVALPRGAKPVAQWPSKDEAFLDILRGLQRVLDRLQHASSRRSSVWMTRPSSLAPGTRSWAYLPYRADRREQTNRVSEVLAKRAREGGSGCVVFAVGGPESEVHEKLVERVAAETLRKYFSRAPHEDPIAVEWPADSVRDKLYYWAVEAMGSFVPAPSTNSRRDPLEELAIAIRRQSYEAFVLHTWLRADTVERDYTALGDWLSWWSDFCKSGGPTPVIFLTVTYPSVRSDEWPIGWWKLRRARRTCGQAQALLLQLQQRKFDALELVVLPDLGPVGHADAVEWVTTVSREQKLAEEEQMAVRMQVKRLYDHRESIPMDELSHDLHAILRAIVGQQKRGEPYGL